MTPTVLENCCHYIVYLRTAAARGVPPGPRCWSSVAITESGLYHNVYCQGVRTRLPDTPQSVIITGIIYDS